MAATEEAVQAAIDSKLIIDGFVSHTGDDIAMLVSHTRGADNDDIHQFAWKTFLEGTAIAQRYGLVRSRPGPVGGRPIREHPGRRACRGRGRV